MTRASLNRTLRRAYFWLGLVLVLSLASKFADRIPWIAGTPVETAAQDLYEYLKDMALVFVTVVAAYLANVFQKRSKFVESLEEEWRGIVRTKSALYTYCEKPYVSTDDYLAAFCRISETIDNMRIVYSNVGETDELIGLYPYAPLHDMRRALQTLGPRKRPDIPPEEKKRALLPVGDAGIGGAVIGRVGLVEHLGIGLERAVAMREAARHPHLPPVGRAQLGRDMLPVGGRALPDVDRDIEDGAARHAHQLALGRGRALEMQSAQHEGGGGDGVVVLHEIGVDAVRGEGAARPHLAEEAARIAVPRRFDEQHLRDGQALDLHAWRPCARSRR